MTLRELLAGYANVPSSMDRPVCGVSSRAQELRAGEVFFALAGQVAHGLDFLSVAVDRGCVAVVWEPPRGDQQAPRTEPRDGMPVPMIELPELSAKLGHIAARFFGDASAELKVVGVTGTNGKTSCVDLIAQALHGNGESVATLGTLGSGLYGDLASAERTTPDAISVQQAMHSAVAKGAKTIAMEVSSHALDQSRTAGVRFDVAAFTNLSRDHLDYHGSMEQYGAAKEKLFHTPSLEFAVVNVDDEFGREMAARLPKSVRLVAYGMERAAVCGRRLQLSARGLEMDVATPWGDAHLSSRLLGRFNAYNLLAVTASLGCLGWAPERIERAVAQLTPVPGRMSSLGGNARQPLIVVDYAHTPDALDQVLKELSEHGQGQLICVFGCGGERDRGKRPLMGRVAERYAQRLVVTDDNPRGEDGDAIVAEILAGLAQPRRAEVVRDRAQAIAYAISHARAGDIVLVAGKGHETYQETAEGRRDFSDIETVRRALGGQA